MTIGDRVNLRGVVKEITFTSKGTILLIEINGAEKGMFESIKINEEALTFEQ